MRRKNGITPEGVGLPKWALDDWRNNYVQRELWRPGEIRPGQELDPKKKKRHGITQVESEPELCHAISRRVPEPVRRFAELGAQAKTMTPVKANLEETWGPKGHQASQEVHVECWGVKLALLGDLDGETDREIHLRQLGCAGGEGGVGRPIGTLRNSIYKTG